MPSTIVMTDEGCEAILKRYLDEETTKLKLFSNNYTPLDTSTVSDFTEAAGGGYADITLDAEYVLLDCETAWTEVIGSGVTASTTATHKRGSLALELSLVASLMTSGIILAAQSLASLTVSTYSYMGVWIRPAVALGSGALRLLLDNTSACASPLESMLLSACSANVWTFHKLTLGNPGACSSLVSLGVRIDDPVDGKIIIDQVAARNWNVDEVVPRDVAYAEQTYTFTGVIGGTGIVYGWYLTDVAAELLIAAGLLTAAFTPSASGGTLKITPKIQTSNGTPS